MRNMIFVEEIIELVSFAVTARREYAQAGKFRIAQKPAATHDEGVDNGRADTGQFGERALKISRGNVKNLAFRRSHSRAGQGRGSLQHGDVPHKVALACGGENLFGLFALLESLDLTAQDDGQAKIALSGLVNVVAAFHDPPFAQWLMQS